MILYFVIHTHTHTCTHTHRYNISTADYDAWNGATNSSIQRLTNIRVFDGQNIVRRTISELDVYSQFGFSEEQSREVSLARVHHFLWIQDMCVIIANNPTPFCCEN